MKLLKSHKSFNGHTQFWSHDSYETKTEMKFSTFIPEGKIKGCLIWLSGLTCNEENFITKAGAQKTLAEQGLMLIAPDTSPRGLNLAGEHDSYDFGSGAGFYLDASNPPFEKNYRMYSYITTELYELIQTKFLVQNISIMGHSMGGHGALIIGLKNPDKFKSISAFSPIVNPILAPWGVKAFLGYLGNDQTDWKDCDSVELLKNGKRHPTSILIHQGTNDEFLTNQLMPENFSEAADKANQKYQLKYCDGYDHSYYFIATYIEEQILHHAQYLK
ncbi:MAG: S-formylglutathione hydrolase [Bacteriovorax sp.]|nr:S-formylglutathione hydrolase [Bacteriovorax sp.]